MTHTKGPKPLALKGYIIFGLEPFCGVIVDENDEVTHKLVDARDQHLVNLFFNAPLLLEALEELLKGGSGHDGPCDNEGNEDCDPCYKHIELCELRKEKAKQAISAAKGKV